MKTNSTPENLAALTAVVVIIIAAGAMSLNQADASNEDFQQGKVVTSAVYADHVQNLSHLANDADSIVIGKVSKVGPAEWRTETGTKPDDVARKDIKEIHHPVTVEVSETFKGSERQQVILQVPGGTVGNYTAKVLNAPGFKQDEEVLLYLRKQNGHYVVLAQKYGKFNVEDETINRPEVEERFQKTLNVSELKSDLRSRYDTSR
jgi:hypothetical protein